MKTFAVAALLGLLSFQEVASAIATPVQTEAVFLQRDDSSSSDSESDEEDVQLAGDRDSYPHWMNGFGGYHQYIRDVPDRFETEQDDTLMRSLYTNYATEGRVGDQPDGHYWVTKENAYKVSHEVVGTHLNLKGGEGDAYLKESFPALWAKYDINEEGLLDIDRMPAFLRTICGNTEACVGLQ